MEHDDEAPHIYPSSPERRISQDGTVTRTESRFLLQLKDSTNILDCTFPQVFALWLPSHCVIALAKSLPKDSQ